MYSLPFRLAALLALAALVGCAANTAVTAPCCYSGPVLTARLAEVPVQLRDGKLVSFGEAYQGFEPATGAFTLLLPVQQMQPSDLIYSSLPPLFALYDANANGEVEEPEMLVLYAREAALALGIPVAHFGAPPGAWALATSYADIGGLVNWVQSRRAQMNPNGTLIFTQLDRLSIDQRTRGSQNGSGAFEEWLD